MLIGLVLVNISQYLPISGHQFVHLKRIQHLTGKYPLIKPEGEKKNKILIQATTWMNLENMMLSEISQSQKDKSYYVISLV